MYVVKALSHNSPDSFSFTPVCWKPYEECFQDSTNPKHVDLEMKEVISNFALKCHSTLH